MKRIKKYLSVILVVVLCCISSQKINAQELTESNVEQSEWEEKEEIEISEVEDSEVNEAEKVEEVEKEETEGELGDGDSTESIPIEKKLPILKYRVHVRNIGWQDWVNEKELAGTVGKACPIEAIIIDTEENQFEGMIEYRVHVQDIGWMNWTSMGEIAGTTGRAKKIEAIQFRLTGEMQENLEIYCQTHVASIGWLSWVKNESEAGTEALGLGVEGIKIQLTEIGDTSNAPEITGQGFVKGCGTSVLEYSGHVRNVGDVAVVKNGETLGTIGKRQALEAVNLNLKFDDEKTIKGGIKYSSHVQNIGWQDWKESGETSGTTGKALSIEAIKIKLTGDIEKYYDIYYRAHVQNFGWLGWAKNGQVAGTTKFAYRMEALQVRLVAKGNTPPGSNSNYYKEAKTGWYYEGGYKYYYKNAVKILDLDNILPKQSSYEIKVNRKMNTVTVYAKDGDNGYIIPVKRFACSVGLPATPTPKGTFYTSQQLRWHMLMGPSYGQYCTRITRDILFHSVAGRNMTSYNLNARDYNKLGSAASHGCVRLNVRDAKWIYDNCALKTKVTIYDSSDPGPLGKPSTIKIPAGQTWDPTDPNVIR